MVKFKSVLYLDDLYINPILLSSENLKCQGSWSKQLSDLSSELKNKFQTLSDAYIVLVKLVFIGSDNVLLCVQRQAIACVNDYLLSIGPSGIKI